MTRRKRRKETMRQNINCTTTMEDQGLIFGGGHVVVEDVGGGIFEDSCLCGIFGDM